MGLRTGMFCRLAVVGVHAAGLGVDRVGQGVDVGALEFGELAVFQQVGDDRVLGREAGEHLLVGGELSGLGLLGLFDEFEFVEKNFAELLGRVEVELVAGDLVDVGL